VYERWQEMEIRRVSVVVVAFKVGRQRNADILACSLKLLKEKIKATLKVKLRK
jgi:hypothetical protein